MTQLQTDLVNRLRTNLFLSNYPAVFAVSNITLEAVECYLTEELIKQGKDPILQCGKNGLWFKGSELVLDASNETRPST